MSYSEENTVAKDNSAESSEDFSEGDLTIVENPSTADLKEEINQLKQSLKILMEKSHSAYLPTHAQQPIVSYVMPNTTATQPAVASCHSTIPLMPQTSIAPMQQICLSEYKPPYMYYMPNTTTPFMPNTTTPFVPHTAAQPFVPNTAAQSFVPNTAAQSFVPNTAAKLFVPNTVAQTIVAGTAAHPTVPNKIFMPLLSSQSTTFMPPQDTLTYTNTATQMTPVVSSNYLPPHSQADTAPFFVPPPVERLRKLHDLPEFSGQPEQWPMFSVAYNETTRIYNYTNLENLMRLQRALKADAKSKVETFLIHPNSVGQVMETLHFHYGRPQVLIRSQIAKVRSFPEISTRKMFELVNFSTMVSNLTVFLENAGATPHLTNPTLIDELVGKLPPSKKEEWMRYSTQTLGQYPSVRQFSAWLQEAATYIALANEIEKNSTHCNKKEKINSTFAITEESRLTECPMCHRNHKLYQCDNFKELTTDDRWKFVKDKNLCFSCLRAGHNTTRCLIKRQCGLSKCTKHHNRLLHEEIKISGKNVNKDRTAVTRDGTKATNVEHENSVVNAIVGNAFGEETLFKFLPVRLSGPKGSVEVVAFIDEGSKISLLEEDIVLQIGLKGSASNLCLGWIGGKTTNEMSKKVNLEISGTGKNSSCFNMKNVRTTGKLKLPPQSLHSANFRKKYPILDKITIEDYFGATPKLLIGLPHIKLVRPFNVINLDDSFALHQTNLGNVLFGSNEHSSEATVCKIDVEVLDDLHEQVAEYFSLENIGVQNTKVIMSHNDERAEQILQLTTMKIGSQYETGLLWRQDEFDHVDSYSVAIKRLQSLEARMKNDENLRDWYKDKIQDYVTKSYARKLLPEEVSCTDPRVWYLPHFAVTNINKGNKRRLVFDAAASINGESFNSRLMRGPCKYQPKLLISILFKFRQRRIAVCADITEMFHRVKIREQDQISQRFLWRGGDSAKPPEVYVMQVMIFGSVSSPCSAQFVKNFNAEQFKDTYPRAARAIIESDYVDDYIDSFDSVDDAIAVTREVVTIHQQANFELRGFVSNAKEFTEAMNSGESDIDKLFSTNLSSGEMLSEKVLGMFWLPSADTFCFILRFNKVPEAVLNGNRRPTKREVLSLTMSIFDPFGFLANIVITSKLLLQELWRCDVDWSTPIPESIYERWFKWYKELQSVEQIKVPRCYGRSVCDPMTSVDLHVFVDASEMAFAAVAYWRISGTDMTDIAFIAGKSRCAPIKPLSIPRLELQAALLGVQLSRTILSGHDIQPKNIIFWSDSKTVIKWIQSDTRIYKQFVAHRISEILEFSELNQWRWVPGLQNPADEATRPKSSSTKSSWLKGPEFLKLNEEHWPKLPDDLSKYDCKSEKRAKFLFTVYDVSYSPFNKFSSYNKLVRVMTWVVRAVTIFKNLSNKKNKPPQIEQYLSAAEIKKTELFLCKIAQSTSFSEEYNELQLNKPVSKSSPIYKLSPYLSDDGLIRLSGRINKASFVPSSTREPIILPKGHVLTNLIIKQYHEDFKHQNLESIVAAIRLKFWVPSLRQLVRSAKSKCQLCKNMSATPNIPLMGQHPTDRLSPFIRPFSYTGVDYMGPFLVSVGRRSEKRWVALFTCLTVRAIHLEVAKDLSTDAVILFIRNFVNRRGLPVRMRSDRGTNFVGASKENCVFEDEKVADECSRRGIEWLFNTPANPAAGGAWERMVRTVKRVLAFTLKEKSPQVDTFNSLLIEAENLVNSRPLTHISIDCADQEPLTPNHFLLGCPNTVQTPVVPERVVLRKQWQILQQLKQTFWKRWVLEYLPDLTRRTKWHRREEPIKVGDVVIICDDNEARGQWKRGVVEEVCMAADGQVRSAVVGTSMGKLKRPASKLAVLDVVGESPSSTHGRRDVAD